MTLKLCINGVEREIAGDPDTPLIYVLRDELGLKGTKLGCGLEQCGACAVLDAGKAVMSCVTPASVFVGREIVTIEGIDALPVGVCVQTAFLDEAAAQCGYCVPGQILSAVALLKENNHPTRAEIIAAMTGNLCRCCNYPNIFAAVESAVESAVEHAAGGTP